MDSIEYYNQNAADYFEKTIDIDMQEQYDCFVDLLPEEGSLLDLGCGSGRDSAYFISRGFDVTAMDASDGMCDLASIHIGQDVLKLTFDEMDFNEVFDGIWACASLLHVPSSEMDRIFKKVIKSLKINGLLFMSFKYGDFEGERDGRYFTDYRTRTLKELIARHGDLEVIDIQKCESQNINNNTIWIYAIVRRIEQE